MPQRGLLNVLVSVYNLRGFFLFIFPTQASNSTLILQAMQCSVFLLKPSIMQPCRLYYKVKMFSLVVSKQNLKKRFEPITFQFPKLKINFLK